MSLTKVSYSMIDGAEVNAADFGVVGDGVADDYAALQAALDATPYGGTLVIPFGGYRITDGLVRTTPISIIGNECEIRPDIDASTTAFTIGSTASSQFKFSVVGVNIASSTANSCKHGLHIQRCQISTFTMRVVCTAAEYAVKISGCVASKFDFNCTYYNSTFPIGSGFNNYGRAANGIWINFDGFNQFNSNELRFWIGLHSGKGLFIDDQGTGGQSSFTGVIESCGGAPLDVTGVYGANFHDIYFENNTGTCVLTNCAFMIFKNWKRGQAVVSALTLDNCRNIEFAGGQHRGDTLTINSNCRHISFTDIDLQGAPIRDLGAINTSYSASVENRNTAGFPVFAPAGEDLANFASNSNFERWISGIPANWNKPAVLTWTKTGVGLSDTTRHTNRYAAYISTTGFTGATFSLDNKSEFLERVKNRYMTYKMYVYVPNTVPNTTSTALFALRCRLVSTSLGNIDYLAQGNRTAVDQWQQLYIGGLYVPPDVTDVQFSLFVGDNTSGTCTYYIADLSVTACAIAPRVYQPEQNNSYSGLYLSGNKIDYGSAAPVAGSWLQGDIIYDTGASAGGTVGWVCTTSGSPGTWKTFGAISA
jgi:hypothetical protein